MTRDTITRLTRQWQDEARAFHDRSLAGVDYVYLWVDGIHLKVRLEADKVCLLVMIGVRADGSKELVRRVEAVAGRRRHDGEISDRDLGKLVSAAAKLEHGRPVAVLDRDFLRGRDALDQRHEPGEIDHQCAGKLDAKRRGDLDFIVVASDPAIGDANACQG